jgi:hypothetical protein
MAPAPTKPGTRKLSEVARHVVVPSGIVSTGYPAVRDRCLDMGSSFDAWQDGVGRLALGKRADGKYAATVGGVVMSIPRQVGKTFTIGSIIFALCINTPGMTVLWTAHRLKTAAETFRSMCGMAKRSKVSPYVSATPRGSGDEAVEFHNGSRILFGAREQGFGRGFAEVDIIVFDEAQILTDKALEDMVPAANQSRQPAGALLFYIGTPPRPTDPGEAFARMRTEALSGESEDTVYIEMSADSDADPDDWDQLAKANPSFPHRTPREAILRLRKKLPVESFVREGLGVWLDPNASKVFGLGFWEACGVVGPPVGVKMAALGLAVSHELTSASVVGAGPAGSRTFVQPLVSGSGTDWVVEHCKTLQRRHKVPLVVDPKGPAADLVPDLVAAGVRVQQPKPAEVLDAFDRMFKLVTDRDLVHCTVPELDRAVNGAVKRAIGDRFTWGRRTSKSDISPLEAATLAVWRVSRPKRSQQPPAPAEIVRQGAPNEMETIGF